MPREVPVAALAAGGLVAAAAALALGWALRAAPPAPEPTCFTGPLAAELGREHLWFGGQLTPAVYAAAPFDVRAQYLVGPSPEAPCADCRTCEVGGAPCKNPDGCGWWGCWQWDHLPPGQFALEFVDQTRAGGGVPLITWYTWLATSGGAEGEEELKALTDPARVRAAVADYRLLLARLAERPEAPILLHLEPDLLGFAQKSGRAAAEVPVALSAADAPACAGLPDDLGGLLRCWIALARAEAPHARVGVHASAWAAGFDAMRDPRPELDREAHARATAAWLAAAGAGAADLVVVEASDRDAGYDGTWWDPAGETLPHFPAALAWARTVGAALRLPHLWWQVPFGHPGLEGTCGRFADNRLDWVVDHPEAVAEAGALGVVFGDGAPCMTTPLTDDGVFLERAAAWFAREPVPLCHR